MITQEYCNNLKKGALVEITWHGGNHGLYRIEKDQFNHSYAVNSIYYNDDGTEMERYKSEIDSLRFYNPIGPLSVSSLKSFTPGNEI